MVAKLGLFIDGRWRSLKSLAAEGRAFDFFVVRRGALKKLPQPPRRSRIVAGLPLPFRKVKRPKVVYKGTDYDELILKSRKRKLPLAEVEINNKCSRSTPVINSQNFKAYKCFPQTMVQKAYKSIPEHYQNNVQEKGVVIKDSSEDENFKLPEKENKNNKLQQTASKQLVSTTEKSNKNLKSAPINDNDDKSNKNLKSALTINDNGDKVTVNTKQKVEKENIPKEDCKIIQQPSTSKGSKKNIASSLKSSSNEKLRNAEKYEKDSSKRKDFNKTAQPSTSKGITQDLQSSSQTNINDKLRSDVTKNGNDEDSAVESESSGPCLELIVEPEDLEMMRKCLMKEPIFKVDIDRFAKDEAYQQRILYKLQPVVQVAYMKPGLHHQLSSSRVGKVSSGSSVPAGREYSSLEDHAIVSWLSASRAREHAVKGNRVWRELQPHHVRLTGQDRSWHSLRNRYLRYILPALGKLALSPAHAQRLRAAAATGEIKRRKQRRPSILHEPAVRTAHQRACVRPSIVPSDSESDGVHHKVRRPSLDHKNKKVSPPSKKQRTEPQKHVAEESSSDDEILHHKAQRPSLRDKNKKVSPPSKTQRTEPRKDVTEDSSNEDEIVHHEVRRPSLRDKNKKVSPPSKKQRTEPQKDVAEDSSSDDEIVQHEVRRLSLRDKNKKVSPPSKKQRTEPQKDVAEDSSNDDGVLHHKVQRPSLRDKNKKVSPPSKTQRTEPRKDVTEDSSNEDDAPLQTSRLRPRRSTLRRLSDASGNDKSYDPSPSSKKKRRRLFNP